MNMKLNQKMFFDFNFRNLGLTLILTVGCFVLTYVVSKYWPSLSNSIAVGIIIFFMSLVYLRGSIYQARLKYKIDLNEARLKLGNLGSTVPLPWSNYSTSPITICDLIENALEPDTGNIIECGTGISTLYLSSIIKNKGDGHLYSIEDDQKWANMVSAYLKQLNLSNYCTIIVAPLKYIEVDGIETEWYDTSQFELDIPEESCGLLYVDGPKWGNKNNPRRYPVLSIFKKYLKSGSKVFLDDADKDESLIIHQKWEHLYKLKRQKNIIYKDRHRKWIFN